MNVKEKIKGLFQQAELVIFFFFLITSLFLGDGKQPFVDVWWALGILMMCGTRYYQRGKLDCRPLPHPIGFAWMALLFYYVVVTPFSDSAGYSITATVRLIEAYLVYIMFATVSSERATSLFTKGLLFVGVVTTLASFVFFLVPSWVSFLPPMNLLYATHGHNHLAGLLLFVFPVAIGLVDRKRNVGTIGILVLFVIGLILTFARGVWVLLVLYLIFIYLKNKSPYLKKVALVGATILVVVFIALSLLSRNGVGTALTQKTPPLARLIQKPSLLADGRWEYWRQAVEAIKERPLFGSGPGTFYLQSKRLQAAPSSYSWFAHSLPLETVVEVGVVGFSLFLVLLYLVFRRANTNPLLWGTILVFMYSFYEFTLDYSSMWLLVWAALGVLTKHGAQTPIRLKINAGVPAAALGILVLFYLSAIGSLGASALDNKTLAFFLAPYNMEIVKETRVLSVATAFHNANPEIYSMLIDSVDDEELKQKNKERLIVLDPWSPSADDVAEYHLKRGAWDKAEKPLLAKRDRDMDYARKVVLSQQMLRLGDGLYRQKRPREAAEWYGSAQALDAWALDKHQPAFLNHAAPAADQLIFFSRLTGVPGQYFGQHREAYKEAWLSAFLDSLRAGSAIDLPSHVKGIMRITPWAQQQIWQEVGTLFVQKAEDKEKAGQSQQAADLLLQAFGLWKLLTQNSQQVDWELQQKTSRTLARVGNALAPRDLLTAGKTYGAALSMVPWIGSQVIPWYTQYTPKEIETSALEVYVKSDATGDPWDQQSKAYATLFLVNKMVDEDKPQDARRYASTFDVPNLIDYAVRKKTAVALQKKADDLLIANRQQDTEALVTAMLKVLPEDYWVQAQQGNFYVAIGDMEKAKTSFAACLVAYVGNHIDCSIGLEAINSGNQDNDRYQQISLIIQGKNRWQDF